MNSDIAGGKWKQVKGDIQKQWGKLTDDEMDEIAGSKTKFQGKMQEKYGHSKEEAEKLWDKMTQKH